MDHSRVAVCVIGRNEGKSLLTTLESVREAGALRVFVDGASTDDSLALAESFSEDIDVVAIGAEESCTAALGRNRGFMHLTGLAPELEFVQFVDGDCILAQDWLEVGVSYLRENPDVGIVAGRLREVDRGRNRYHRIADMEWNTEVGTVDATGGICIVRVDAFERAGGLDGTIARGEEAEFARRVRDKGYRVVRLADEMARHDIDMDRFSQWWRRSVRYGCGVAEELERDGLSSRGALYRVFSILVWGWGIPIAAVGLAVPTHYWSLALLSLYSILWTRVRSDRLLRGDSKEDAGLYATSILFGKTASACGVFLATWTILLRRKANARPGGRGTSVEGNLQQESSQIGAQGTSSRLDGLGGVGKDLGRVPSTVKACLRWNIVKGASALGALTFFEARMARGLTTLMYHRVLPDELCPIYPLESLVIPIGAFKQQMRCIAEHYDAGTVGEGLRALGEGRSAKPRVAISFDDGYLDNFEIVAPILEECGLHATFFAATDFISEGHPMWFDEACLLLVALGPELSCTSFSGEAPKNGASLMAWMILMKSLAPDEREDALCQWRETLQEIVQGRTLDLSAFRAMQPANLKALHERGHEIGSHTCSHPMLSQLGPEDVARELTASKTQLEEWIGAPVEGFCYPNGDNDDAIQRAVSQAGYRWACTADAGLYSSRDAEVTVPRVGITSQHVLDRHGEHDDELFRAQVCQFRGAVRHPWS